MIHSEIVQFLSEIDTNIFLSFNGIHSPFWDYFMTSFTGKIIWVPMYATILHILLKNFHWKAVLCYVVAIALTITGCSTSASRQPWKSDCRYGIYCKWIPRWKLRFPILPCRQFIRTCPICDMYVPQTLAKSFYHSMGCTQLLYPHLSGGTLSRRFTCRRYHRRIRRMDVQYYCS